MSDQHTPAVADTPEQATPQAEHAPSVTMQEVMAVVNAAVETAVANAIAQAFQPYSEILSALKANADGERQQLIAELSANEACPFDEARLSAFSTNDLKAMKSAFSPAVPDYSGRGVANTYQPIAVNADDEWEVLPTKSVFAANGSR